MKIEDLAIITVRKGEPHDMASHELHNICRVCNLKMWQMNDWDIRWPEPNDGCLDIRVWVIHYLDKHPFELEVIKAAERA